MKINVCNDTVSEAAKSALGAEGSSDRLEIILTGAKESKKKASVTYRKAKSTGRAVIQGSAPTPETLRDAAVLCVAFALRRIKDGVEKGKLPDSYIEEARKHFDWPSQSEWDQSALALIQATAPKAGSTLREYVLRFGKFLAVVRVPEPRKSKAEGAQSKSEQGFAAFTALVSTMTKEIPGFSYVTLAEFEKSKKEAEIAENMTNTIEIWRDHGVTKEQILAAYAPKPEPVTKAKAN